MRENLAILQERLEGKRKRKDEKQRRLLKLWGHMGQ